MDNSLIPKSYFPQCLLFSIIIHWKRSYICWLDVIGLGSSNNTGVSKQNTHTHTHTHASNTQRKITLERVSMKISDSPPFLKEPPYFTNPSLFMAKIWTLYKGGVSNYVIALSSDTKASNWKIFSKRNVSLKIFLQMWYKGLKIRLFRSEMTPLIITCPKTKL